MGARVEAIPAGRAAGLIDDDFHHDHVLKIVGRNKRIREEEEGKDYRRRWRIRKYYKRKKSK